MNSILLIIFLCVLLVFPADLFVKRVIDGDTFELSNGERVRLIGIDAPEVYDSPKLYRDAKKRGIPEVVIKKEGLKAKHFIKKLVLRKKVRLAFGKTRRDKYGRLLAYAFVADTVFVNKVMVKVGMAEVYRKFPFKYKGEFLKLEEEAKAEKRGLWNRIGRHSSE